MDHQTETAHRGAQIAVGAKGKESIPICHEVGLIGLANVVLDSSTVLAEATPTRNEVRAAVDKACHPVVSLKERLRVKVKVTATDTDKAQENLRNETLPTVVPAGTVWSTIWLGRNSKSATSPLEVERSVGRLGLSLWGVRE